MKPLHGPTITVMQGNRSGGLSKARIEALTDGVFAIAMTFLVFGIKVPDLSANPTVSLERQLLNLWPSFLSYSISFIILGVYWVGHHNQFHYVQRTDRVFLWLNIFFLMSVTLIPFSTALLGRFPNQRISLILYGLNMTIVGFLLYGHWSYATTRHRLVDKEIHPEVVTLAKRRILAGPAVLLFAMALSFVSPRISLIVYGLLPLLYLIPGRIDKHWIISAAEHVVHRQTHDTAESR